LATYGIIGFMTKITSQPGPKLLDGRQPAAFIQTRHVQLVAALEPKPRMAIIRSQSNPAGDWRLSHQAKTSMVLAPTAHSNRAR
jgi:hypothetical protein